MNVYSGVVEFYRSPIGMHRPTGVSCTRLPRGHKFGFLKSTTTQQGMALSALFLSCSRQPGTHFWGCYHTLLFFFFARTAFILGSDRGQGMALDDLSSTLSTYHIGPKDEYAMDMMWLLHQPSRLKCSVT